MECSICGKNYRRKITGHNILWCCGTYNTKGKSYCDSKTIPEETLKHCIATALGVKIFDEKEFKERIEYMIARPGNTICLVFKDGVERTITWKDRSRSESWTPEMREAAKQKTLKRKEQTDGK